MKRFLKITALFLLPFVLFYGLLGIFFVNSREGAPLDEVVSATVDGSLVLYGSAYHENFQAYKYRVVSQLAPSLLVLGTSRSMPLRSTFFTEKSFYNAGGTVKNAQDYLRFLQQLPAESRPGTVFMVLDQNMFNDEWAFNNRTAGLALSDLPVKGDVLLRMGNSYGDGKFSILKNLSGRTGCYGVAAVGRSSGFTADGSYRYGVAAEANLSAPERNFADSYRNIDFSQLRFAWGDEPSEWALDQMDQLLRWCREEQIQVVAMLAPLPPTVYERMIASGNFGYLEKLPGALSELFAGYGYLCFDESYLPDTTAVQYLDGFHGGDEVYAQALLQLAEENTVMARLVDSQAVADLLAQPHENPRVLPG